MKSFCNSRRFCRVKSARVRILEMRNKLGVYCLTRSVGNRHWDVLGSRKLPVERDGRFPTTKICSYTNPPSPFHLCSSDPSIAVSCIDDVALVLLICTYLFLLSTQGTRTYASNRERERKREGMKRGEEKLYRRLPRCGEAVRRCEERFLNIALRGAPDYRPSGYGKS